MNLDDIKSIQKIASQAMNLLNKYAPHDEEEDWESDNDEDDFEDDDEYDDE